MAPMKQQSNSSSSNYYGEDATVLASCYFVDATGMKAVHYCTTSLHGLPSPPSSPPLAAVTASRQLAILPKTSSTGSRRNAELPGKRLGRRGGAALAIREECERFFCESMRTVFHGERSTIARGSGLTGVNDMHTPPPDDDLDEQQFTNAMKNGREQPFEVVAWLEVWDWVGGVSFRAFMADDGKEKSLFAFLDKHAVLGRDLKSAIMALMELAEYFGCEQVVTCLDRSIPNEDAKTLMTGLRWCSFELTTLDHWAHDLDVTSKRWVFMGCET